MKTAIISDIHSNPAALEKVISDAKNHGCDKFLCLGDIVGYGYDPNTCIDICRRENIFCLMGNHDAGLVGRLSLDWFNAFAREGVVRQRGVVSDGDRKWLDSLPYKHIEDRTDSFATAFAHGTYDFPERFEYISYACDAAFEVSSLKQDRIRALFVGHTHCANVYMVDENYNVSETYLGLDTVEPIDLTKNLVSIVNVGSCGYPRNQPYTIYCIYDDEKKTATHRILEFDFDDYCKKMAAANIEIPLWVKSREKEAEERRIGWR